MCGQPREITGEEKEIREYIAMKWESILTHERYARLLEVLVYDLKTDGACSASSHYIDESFA